MLCCGHLAFEEIPRNNCGTFLDCGPFVSPFVFVFNMITA